MKMLTKNLSILRHKFGYTQNALADKLFVSRQAISKWERGESYPDLDTLMVLSSLYGVSIDAMIKEDLSQFSNQHTTLQSCDEVMFDDIKSKHKKSLAIKMALVALALIGTYSLIVGIIFSSLINTVDGIWIIWFSLPIVPPIIFAIIFRHDLKKKILPFFVDMPFISGQLFLIINMFSDTYSAWLVFLLIPAYYAFAISFFFILHKKDKNSAEQLKTT